MSKEQKPGTGVAFPNKSPGQGRPDYRGFLMLSTGEVVGVAIWSKQPKNGGPFFLSISQDDREGEYHARNLRAALFGAAAPPQPNPARTFSDDDDEIPF
jgi:hypothetical protein